jgi:hypothetical protein
MTRQTFSEHSVLSVISPTPIRDTRFAFTECAKLLLPTLHLEQIPDVAASLLPFIFCVSDVQRVNGPLRASVKSGARGPLVFRAYLLDLLDKFVLRYALSARFYCAER